MISVTSSKRYPCTDKCLQYFLPADTPTLSFLACTLQLTSVFFPKHICTFSNYLNNYSLLISVHCQMTLAISCYRYPYTVKRLLPHVLQVQDMFNKAAQDSDMVCIRRKENSP